MERMLLEHTTAGLRSLSFLDVFGLCGMFHYSGYPGNICFASSKLIDCALSPVSPFSVTSAGL